MVNMPLAVNALQEWVERTFEMARGGFHKSWAHGVKRRAHPSLGENAIS
jgi:hypothetical protein